MKKVIPFILIIVSLTLNSQSLPEILSPKQMTITWLGVDFTHGRYSVAAPEKIKKYLPDYCARINKTIAENHSRYYFPIAYKKDFIYDTKVIDEVNSHIDTNVVVTRKKDLLELDAKQIQQIVSSFSFPESLTGIGLIYIYESLSQGGNDKGTVWMAYIDIQSKQILFLQNTSSGVEGKNIEENIAYPVLSMIRKVKSDLNKWEINPEKYNLIGK